jgi:predicted PurR-regulated permease PerM
VLVAVIGAAIAIAADPAIHWLDRRGLKRGYGAPLLVLGGAALVAGFFALSAASLVADAQLLEQRAIDFYQGVLATLPTSTQRAVGSLAPTPESLLAAGQMALGGVGAVALALVLAVYFLVDGRRTYAWLRAFVPARHRAQVDETAAGACVAIAAYMRGNLITSVIAGAAAFVVLSVLHVPAALLLAVLAFICDFLPVVGLVLSAGPAILLGLMVSPTVAVAVFGYFVAYHVIENYYIGPRVYGGELRLSDLAVIAAFLVGAELGGVLGALVALPLAAIYPVIERVWLRETRADLPRVHERIEAQPEH